MSSTSTQTQVMLTPGSIVNGNLATYTVVEELGRGGRGQTFLARVLSIHPGQETAASECGLADQHQLVLKTIGLDQKRGYRANSTFCARMDSKIEGEAQALRELRDVDCVAQCYDQGTWRSVWPGGDVLSPRFMIQQFIEGERLDKYLEELKPRGEFKGIESADDWLALASNLTEALAAIHRTGVIHADIWCNNLIVLTGTGLEGERRTPATAQPVYIDFGESVFRDEQNPMPGSWSRNDVYVAPEWREGDVGSDPRGDIYSLGGVLFYLATGEDPPSKFSRELEQAKSELLERLNHRNSALIRDNAGVADIIARCLRRDRERRLPDAETLRREIRMFSGGDAPDAPPTAEGITESIESLSAIPLFLRMTDILLRRVQLFLDDMTNGCMDLSGDHEEIVAAFSEFISVLRDGDDYMAISIPSFWAPENLGMNGRFRSMNLRCAQSGVDVRRIFVLEQSDFTDSQSVNILRSQIAMVQETRDAGFGCMDMRYIKEGKKERKGRVDHGGHRGLMISGGVAITCVPIYDDNDLIRQIRIRRSDANPAFLREEFDRVWEGGDSIDHLKVELDAAG